MTLSPGTPGTAVSVGDGAYTLTVNPAFGGIYQISVQLGAAEIGEGDFPLRGIKFLTPPLSAALSYGRRHLGGYPHFREHVDGFPHFKSSSWVVTLPL